jgi:hypothetical protein
VHDSAKRSNPLRKQANSHISKYKFACMQADKKYFLESAQAAGVVSHLRDTTSVIVVLAPSRGTAYETGPEDIRRHSI